eukprot:jgi/Chlat1/4674/Chrsp3S05641
MAGLGVMSATSLPTVLRLAPDIGSMFLEHHNRCPFLWMLRFEFNLNSRSWGHLHNKQVMSTTSNGARNIQVAMHAPH